MKLLVATRSTGKQREVRRLLADAGLDLVFPEDINLFEDPAEELLENSDSFRANARAKAEHFAKRSGLPTVADDSGLEVFYLGGAPGTRSKRWAGASGRAASGRCWPASAAARPARWTCSWSSSPSWAPSWT